MTEEQNQEVVQDLEQRIDTLQNLDDAEFGGFGRSDFVILVVFAVLVPALALVWAA